DEEVEEIVPGVDRRESEPERGAEAPPAVARGPEPTPRPPPPEPTLGCHARVTGERAAGRGRLDHAARVRIAGRGWASSRHRNLAHDGADDGLGVDGTTAPRRIVVSSPTPG